ncbi:MAG: hypothetical protein V2A67_00850 [Bacteroidota bacterium]
MKEMKWARILLIGVFSLGFFGSAMAQDINAAIGTYNSALTTMKSDPATAITSLQLCIELCDKIGPSADSIKTVANAKFAETYFNLATKQAGSKDLAGATETFKQAIQFGEQTQNAEVLKRSNAALSQVYYMQADGYRTQKDLIKAQEFIDLSLGIDSTSSRAWIVQAYIYRDGNMVEGFEKAIERVNLCTKNVNETKLANNAGLKYFLSTGSQAVNTSKFEEGVPALEKCLKYDEANKDVFYYLAKGYNGLKLWDKAIETANKGIAMEEDVPEKEAKFWFEVGTAYAGKEDKAKACESFKKAQFGQFAENAKYEIEVTLKCGK